ncbi:MAG: dihydropyrimidine dehydrogenase, partial [Verrucomicrobia bacterium]|nr:dihydropyrimidine dehydrogenase [Verrucomicrobiota bacterium]
MKSRDGTFVEAQLRAELDRCAYCATKPCQAACPADCSPADFIMAARVGEAADYRRAAELILGANPLGGVCGAVCPDTFCMAACTRRRVDGAINIPAVQATIVRRGRAAGLSRAAAPAWNGRTVAVIGAGPAGLAA